MSSLSYNLKPSGLYRPRGYPGFIHGQLHIKGKPCLYTIDNLEDTPWLLETSTLATGPLITQCSSSGPHSPAHEKQVGYSRTPQTRTPSLGDPDIPKYPLEDQERPKDQRDPEDPNDSEDDNYLPPIEEEDSPEDEDLIVPETIEDHERSRQQLLATGRSLKAKARQLKAEQDTLNDRWTRVLSAVEGYGTGLLDQPKS